MSGPYWQDQFNPTHGCTPESPGCAACWAKEMHERFHSEPFSDVRLLPEVLSKPLRRRKPTTYFVCNTSDLFHPSIPDEYIAAVFGVMAACPQHTFLVLTKRAERMREVLSRIAEQLPHLPEGPAYFCTTKAMETRAVTFPTSLRLPAWPLPNVWLGVTVEDQQRADERIPALIATPAVHRWVSIEPMLGPLDLFHVAIPDAPSPPFTGNALREYRGFKNRLDAVIMGGESGPKARPSDIDWHRRIVRQCAQSGIPCFEKQLGSNARTRNDEDWTNCWGSGQGWPEHIEAEDRIEHNPDGHLDEYQGAPVRVHFRHRSGGDPSEWPEDLRVRELAWEVRS